MSFPPKPAIVLVHGVWHSPLTYSKFTAALRHKGYDVHAPFLPSCAGLQPPTVGLSVDTQLVRRTVEMLANQGRTIIMVVHSYGGVPGCSALEGLDLKSRIARGESGGVAQILAMAAHLHPKGFAVMDIVTEMGDDALIPYAFDVASDGSCFAVDPRASLFSELSKEEADSALLTLSRASWDALHSKAQFEAWKYIPVTYVNTTQDVTFPPHYQNRVLEKLEKAGALLTVVKLETGHSPYLTKTAEVVSLIDDLARKTG